MRFISRFLLGATLVLCWSGIANANPNENDASLDPAVFRAVTQMQLDAAFEAFVARGHGHWIHGLSGPSSMSCENARMQDGIETCVVTASRPTNSMPAALAQH